MDDETPARANYQLRQRNSVATPVVVPSKLSLPKEHHHGSASPSSTITTITKTSSTSSSSSSQSFPSDDFDLISVKPLSYTSLKDILPSAAIQSPTGGASATNSGYEISIRNRLVKQAAWAYLRPMSTLPDSSSGSFLHHLWVNFSGDYLKNPIAALLRFVDCHIIRTINGIFDQLLRGIRIQFSRKR